MLYILFTSISGLTMIVLMVALVGSHFEYKRKAVLPIAETIEKMEAEVKSIYTKLELIKNKQNSAKELNS